MSERAEPFPRPAGRAVVIVLVILLALPFGLTSCRPGEPADDPGAVGEGPAPGDTGDGAPGDDDSSGDGEPPQEQASAGILTAGDSVAVGPFENLRSSGWIAEGLAWGWGDVDASLP